MIMKRFRMATISLLAAAGFALAQAPEPFQLTINAGTFVTVRVDEPLSSDRNQPGDAFSATLMQPLVVDGVVVAQRGQTIGGRVTEAQKAGRVQSPGWGFN